MEKMCCELRQKKRGETNMLQKVCSRRKGSSEKKRTLEHHYKNGTLEVLFIEVQLKNMERLNVY